MIKNLKDSKDTGKLVTELSHLAHTYISSYRPTAADLKKQRVLKTLRKNGNIVMLQPDKGNGVVVLDRAAHDRGIFKIINDTSKFKALSNDPTLAREGKLQHVLRDLKKKGHLDQEVYDTIYPSGSQPARIYGLPKMHKPWAPNSIPRFRPIVSSIGTYNYNLAKFLSNLLQAHIPAQYFASDTFTFAREINGFSMEGNCMVSFDVESWMNVLTWPIKSDAWLVFSLGIAASLGLISKDFKTPTKLVQYYTTQVSIRANTFTFICGSGTPPTSVTIKDGFTIWVLPIKRNFDIHHLNHFK